MIDTNLVIHQEEYEVINKALKELYEQTVSKLVLLVDKNGQQIATFGDTQLFDTAAFASLTVSNIIAANNIAELLGQKEFSLLAQEGESNNIYISLILDRIILIVVFTKLTSLGLVRLRVKKASIIFSDIFNKIFERAREDEKLKKEPYLFDEVTEEDIDKLFRKIFRL